MRLLFLKLPLALLKLGFYLFVFSMPLLSVWLATSLVAYTNGQIWLALLAGLLLFPLLPVMWELLRHKKSSEQAILTRADRIILRTLAINVLFIGVFLAARPQTAFLALSTRGDWMLEGQHEPPAELARHGLFKMANGLEWLYLAFHKNPYQQFGDSVQPEPVPQPPSNQPSPTPPPAQTETAGGAQPQTSPQPPAEPPTNLTSWPWPQQIGLHSAVTNMPAEAEESLEKVAKYIVQQEKDPFLRVKALHDYVADRVAYDAEALSKGDYPPQDAKTVFKTRTAVCAGYSELLKALGKAAGEEIIIVLGDVRGQNNALSGEGHAWNAAKIQGNWYLLDATWDSGTVKDNIFKKKYSTQHLFTPPLVMAVTHYPDKAAWQLLPKPLTRGEFLRQPALAPEFFALGLKLISPTRSQTDTQDVAAIEMENDGRLWFLATYKNKGNGQVENCPEQPVQSNKVLCTLPAPGDYEVRLFAGTERYGNFSPVGNFEFNNK